MKISGFLVPIFVPLLGFNYESFANNLSCSAKAAAGLAILERSSDFTKDQLTKIARQSYYDSVRQLVEAYAFYSKLPSAITTSETISRDLDILRFTLRFIGNGSEIKPEKSVRHFEASKSNFSNSPEGQTLLKEEGLARYRFHLGISSHDIDSLSARKDVATAALISNYLELANMPFMSRAYVHIKKTLAKIAPVLKSIALGHETPDLISFEKDVAAEVAAVHRENEVPKRIKPEPVDDLRIYATSIGVTPRQLDYLKARSARDQNIEVLITLYLQAKKIKRTHLIANWQLEEVILTLQNMLLRTSKGVQITTLPEQLKSIERALPDLERIP